VDYNWYPAYNTVPEKVRKEIEAEGKPLPHQWFVLMQQVDAKRGTPYIHDIILKNIEAIDCRTAFSVQGRENQKAGQFRLENIYITAAQAGTIANAENWTFKNVRVEAKDGSKVTLKNCVNMQGLSSSEK
jgi:hypothetical protein